MTSGGPGYASMVMVMAIYRAGFQNYQMGYASAIAVVLFFMHLRHLARAVQAVRQGGAVLMAGRSLPRRLEPATIPGGPVQRGRASTSASQSPRQIALYVQRMSPPHALPVLWMIATALRPAGHEADLSLIPRPYLAFENFARAWNFRGIFFTQYTINSLLFIAGLDRAGGRR